VQMSAEDVKSQVDVLFTSLAAAAREGVLGSSGDHHGATPDPARALDLVVNSMETAAWRCTKLRQALGAALEPPGPVGRLGV